MDILIPFIAELIAPLVGGTAAVIIVVAGQFLGLVLKVREVRGRRRGVADAAVAAVTDGRRQARGRKAAKETPVGEKPRKRLGFRGFVRRSLLFLLLFTVLVIAAIQFVLFEPALRVIAKRVERETGHTIEFENASGNLLGGQLELEDLHLVSNGEEEAYDLRIEQFSIDVSIVSIALPWAETRVERVEVVGIDGRIDRLPASRRHARGDSFVIDELVVRQSRIRLGAGDGDPRGVEVVIDTAETHDVPSRDALLDLLLDAHAHGKIQGRPFWIEPGEKEGELATWRFENVDHRLLGEVFGFPFVWVAGGKVDVLAKHSASDTSRGVETTWLIVCKDAGFAAPPDLTLGASALKTIAAHYNARVGTVGGLEIRFDSRMPRFLFDRALKTGEAGSLGPIRRALIATMIEESGANEERIHAALESLGLMPEPPRRGGLYSGDGPRGDRGGGGRRDGRRGDD